MALMLSRNQGESIIIDGHIRIQVAEIRGNRVKLAVVAPRSVRVEREDQYDERREFQEGNHR